MKAFWRFVIGGGMALFGIIGLISVLFLQPEDGGKIAQVFPSFNPLDDTSPADTDEEQKKTSGKDGEKTPEEIAVLKERHDKDRELLQEAVSERDVDKCLLIDDEKWKLECRDSIYFAMALRDQYIDLCDKIETPEKKRYCRDELLLDTAKAESDFTFCADIVNGTLRSQCQEAEARDSIMKVKSVEDCEKIKSKEERELCYGFFVTRAAAAAPEPEIDACDEIIDDGQKRNCRLNMAVEKAGQEKDPTVCRDLADAEEVNDCLRGVETTYENDRMSTIISAGAVEKCASLKDESTREYCEDQALVRKATAEHDPELCMKIKTDRHRDKCREEATKATNLYFYDLARKDNDPKWCRLILTESARMSCENHLASAAAAAQKD